MAVLVTGGFGFIGSHLCMQLLKQNEEIVILDNMSDYYDNRIKYSHMKRLIDVGKDKISYYLKDIRDRDSLEWIFSNHKIEAVIHLAACAGVRPSIADPILYSDVNVNGTTQLLEMMKKFKVINYIFGSSSSVYGDRLDQRAYREEDISSLPISPYAATKSYGELLSYTYHHLYDINVACLRFFTVYGPYQRLDLAISKFVDAIMNHREIVLYGDGSSERDYTYIDDIVDGIVRCMKWIVKQEKTYQIFNLGSSSPIQLTEMIRHIERVTEKQAMVRIADVQDGDVRRTYADISKARSILGYNPMTDFEQGIRKYVSWYKVHHALMV